MLCLCGCGKETLVAKRNRKERGQVKGESMPYLHGHSQHMKHGHCRRTGASSEFSTYQAAKQRCINPKNKNYDYYGGRGIKFLFLDFQQFFSELGKRPKGKSLDRKNNDGHYEPGNVRWATKAQQDKNKRKWGTCRQSQKT